MEVVVPDLGDFADVEVIEILVKPGDDVAAEQGLVTLETEKATMDIPSPVAGRIAAVSVNVGDRVSTGSVIAQIESAEEAPKAAPSPAASKHADTAAPETESAPVPAQHAEPQTVVVPDLGDFADVEIIEILVKPGDQVTAEQGLLTLETGG